MRSINRFILLTALVCLLHPATAQTLCNSNGNLVIFSNYDGGVLNIDCDVNIPNLKIGVCTYEPVTVNITGAFASNVTEVRYAGYVSTNNFHCSNSPSTTTITGVPANITSVNFLPQATLSNPNGSNSIVCAYSCTTTSSQGGCNTADQIVDYFQTSMGATIRSYFTQYGCWSPNAYAVSAGGNCCPPGSIACNLTAHAGPDTTICSGNSISLQGQTSGGTTFNWSPGTGLSCTNCQNPLASPTTTTTYVLTVTDGGNCVEMDTVTVTVSAPQVSTQPFPGHCLNDPSFTLTGGAPANGTWSGTGVSNGAFFPAIAGPGTHTLTYTVVDFFGCVGTSTESITVFALPTVTQAPFPSMCANDSLLFLSGGSPPGGSYSGAGVIGAVFDPGVSGVGSFPLTYTYVDGNGCSNQATQTLTVHAHPSTPLISQAGADSLYASLPADSFHWSLNGSPFPGTGQGIQTMQNGSYTVIAWVNGCPSAPSTVYPFEFVALDQAVRGSWSVYPNPAGSFVRVRGPVGSFSYTLHDLTGRALLSGVSHSEEVRIDLKDLAAGQYVLEINSEMGRHYRKVVVQR